MTARGPATNPPSDPRVFDSVPTTTGARRARTGWQGRARRGPRRGPAARRGVGRSPPGPRRRPRRRPSRRPSPTPPVRGGPCGRGAGPRAGRGRCGGRPRAGSGEPDAVDDRRVVELVARSRVVGSRRVVSAPSTQVGGEPGGKPRADSVPFQPRARPPFLFAGRPPTMSRGCPGAGAVRSSAAWAAATTAGMLRQSQVVVRREVHDLGAVGSVGWTVPSESVRRVRHRPSLGDGSVRLATASRNEPTAQASRRPPPRPLRAGTSAMASARPTRCVPPRPVVVSNGTITTTSPSGRISTPRATQAALTLRPQRSPSAGGSSSMPIISPCWRISDTPGNGATRSFRSAANWSRRAERCRARPRRPAAGGGPTPPQRRGRSRRRSGRGRRSARPGRDR